MTDEKINNNDYLLAPNIYLFAYQLRDELATGKTDPFWPKCNGLLSQFTETRLTEKLDFSSVESSDRAILLQDKAAISFTVSESPKIEGFVQPWQIQDSYALFFNIGYDNEGKQIEKVGFDDIKNLNPNKAFLFAENDNFLGATLLITAYLPTINRRDDPEYLLHIANNCYAALFDNNEPPLYRSGELFGSSIFEYGDPKKNANKTRSYRQVIVWLFRNEAAEKEVNKCLNNISDLLFYRAKIVKAFGDRRLVYEKLDEAYRKIDKDLDRLQNKLDYRDASSRDIYLGDFKTQLKSFARESLPYTRLLQKMKNLDNTIEIHLFNYNETIERICAKLRIDKKELSFLNYFGEETAPHFHRQIKADLGYFKRGTDLTSQAIASIRGIVEIDRAKRDRDLEKQIQAVGVGIAAGAIVASTSGLIAQPWDLPSRDRPLRPLHPFMVALIISIFCAWGAWWIAKKGIQKKR